VGQFIEFYGGNQGSSADPWTEIGIHVKNGSSWPSAQIYLYNPCGITNINFGDDGVVASGEKWRESTAAEFTAEVRSSINGLNWTTEYTVPDGNASMWETWSYSGAITSGSLYIAIYLKAHSTALIEHWVECDDVVLTLESNYTPSVTVGSAVSNYPLDCTITNETTGESIDVDATLIVDETLTIDTDEKSVRDGDNISNYNALDFSTVRRDWLRMTPGVNVITFEDTGTNELDIEIYWDRRFFE
jgi:hypothetical protein